ncbi:MAG: ABC transporter ATP-binding protein [Nanoarchaeota archaeon]|nr:ABC transporter ATP-binding protein [Nanoarchaeota archaeon]
MNTILNLNKVKKNFVINGKKETVLDINLNVNKGEFVTILGPSGCGKTTLINLIAGFIKPDEGRVTFYDRKISGPHPDRNVVFQEYAVFPWRTVLENVKLGLESKNITKDEQESLAKKYLRLVGLEDVANMYPFELSGGMKQRVAIARTLATDPKILLMDEPFGSLDAQRREILQDELLKIYEKTKKTVIFVTHNIEESIYLGKRLIVLKPGKNSIKLDISINLPKSRDRTSERFRKIEKKVRQYLT